jgi:hypothetical protein
MRKCDRICGFAFTEAVLWVLTGNDRAERFYRADGWLPDGRRREEDVCGHSSEQHPLSTPSSLTLVSVRREGLASR